MKFAILFAVILVSASASKLRSEKIPALQISSRTKNAQDAAIQRFAYQVKIVQRRNSTSPYIWCGGSLVGHEWILTAAHCVFGRRSVVVYLGSSDRSKHQKIYRVYRKDFLVHQWFTTSPIENDIALIRIPYTDYTKNIRNIRLPAMTEYYPSFYDEDVIASVWGPESDIASIATDLKWGRFYIITNEDCYKYYGTVVSSTSFCIAFSGRVSSCTIDSGAPLVFEGSNIQVGIQSFVSNGCCTRNTTAVFTRVNNFLDWILEKTGISY